jgi:hypothetical protein
MSIILPGLFTQVESALASGRGLSKAAIYAAAEIPEHWLVNLRDDCVEVFRAPDATASRYRETPTGHRSERLELVALPGASVLVEDLLPSRS